MILVCVINEEEIPLMNLNPEQEIELEEGIYKFMEWANNIPEDLWPPPVPTWKPKLVVIKDYAFGALASAVRHRKYRCDSSTRIRSINRPFTCKSSCVEWTVKGIKPVDCYHNVRNLVHNKATSLSFGTIVSVGSVPFQSVIAAFISVVLGMVFWS